MLLAAWKAGLRIDEDVLESEGGSQEQDKDLRLNVSKRKFADVDTF